MTSCPGPGKTIEESGIVLHVFYIHYRCYRLDIKLYQSSIL